MEGRRKKRRLIKRQEAEGESRGRKRQKGRKRREGCTNKQRSAIGPNRGKHKGDFVNLLFVGRRPVELRKRDKHRNNKVMKETTDVQGKQTVGSRRSRKIRPLSQRRKGKKREKRKKIHGTRFTWRSRLISSIRACIRRHSVCTI